MATPGRGETVDFEGQRVTAVPAPQDDTGRAAATSLSEAGLQAQIIYVEKFDGKIDQADVAKQEAEARSRLEFGSGGGGIGIAAILVLFAALIALWFYFGGGALLAADTSDKPKVARQLPDGWADTAADLSGNSSLREIAAMADRRAALVRLLRLCLLRAAEVTQTGFRRSDTEREAFRRLPDRWDGIGYLKRLLVAAELAHYGGRPVREDDFMTLIDGARGILPRQAGGNV